MEDFILKQLNTTPEKYTPKKEYFVKSSSKKIYYHQHKLMFLRIFKEIRKKLKRGNQFDVAIQIKEIFKNARLAGTFDYVSTGEHKYNSETEQYEFFTFSDADLDIKTHKILELRRKFLKEIGLTEKSFNYLYGGFELSTVNTLNDYFAYATPRAIIQMRKRLLKSSTFSI